MNRKDISINKAINTDQLVALIVAKVTIDTDIGGKSITETFITLTHDHVSLYICLSQLH